jgi:hypothetical protein
MSLLLLVRSSLAHTAGFTLESRQFSYSEYSYALVACSIAKVVVSLEPSFHDCISAKTGVAGDRWRSAPDSRQKRKFVHPVGLEGKAASQHNSAAAEMASVRIFD